MIWATAIATQPARQFWGVEDEIFINHRPVYMRGNQKEFMGFSWDGGCVKELRGGIQVQTILWSIL
jgi:hypothetical protein